jgi:hypothetical protein
VGLEFGFRQESSFERQVQNVPCFLYIGPVEVIFNRVKGIRIIYPHLRKQSPVPVQCHRSRDDFSEIALVEIQPSRFMFLGDELEDWISGRH